MLRQCAWCWSVADSSGRYHLQPGSSKLPEATHGICPACWQREMAALDKQHIELRQPRPGRLTPS